MIYVQVALNTENESTLRRELRVLEKIPDSFPKYLLTMDQIHPEQNFNGIQKTSVLNWLLADY